MSHDYKRSAELSAKVKSELAVLFPKRAELGDLMTALEELIDFKIEEATDDLRDRLTESGDYRRDY